MKVQTSSHTRSTLHSLDRTTERRACIMEKISVVINTYNASLHLRSVLDSVKDFDEVLLCDMESTDDTLSIFETFSQTPGLQCSCRTITFPRKEYNIVEPAREYAIHEAASEWVLVVDADEIVSNELRQFLYDTIQKPEAPAGLRIPRKNYFMGRFMHCHYPDYILRFFRRDVTHWPPVIHCSPEVAGKIEDIPSNRTDLAFEHLANDSVGAIVRKTDQYTDNEVPKKRHKKYGIIAYMWRPFFRFFKAYILKGGWRDGRPGFIKACLEGQYQFVILAKLDEEKHRILNDMKSNLAQ